MWTLIFFWVTSYSTTIDHIDGFATRDLCVQAGENATAQLKSMSSSNHRYVCAQKQ